MKLEEAINQLISLQEDRKSFMEDEEEKDSIFMQDYKAIETVLSELERLRKESEEKCLHCGTGKPAYCEECFQELITENLKLQSKIKEERRIISVPLIYSICYAYSMPYI